MADVTALWMPNVPQLRPVKEEERKSNQRETEKKRARKRADKTLGAGTDPDLTPDTPQGLGANDGEKRRGLILDVEA